MRVCTKEFLLRCRCAQSNLRHQLIKGAPVPFIPTAASDLRKWDRAGIGVLCSENIHLRVAGSNASQQGPFPTPMELWKPQYLSFLMETLTEIAFCNLASPSVGPQGLYKSTTQASLARLTHPAATASSGRTAPCGCVRSIRGAGRSAVTLRRPMPTWRKPASVASATGMMLR